ncbi:MAG: hypothetical protein M0C28_21420 [Candidatus Moduliflexus flocculans]|nr:hypothetical protein [Candidatus Moduliflexus flocculans]
MVVEKLAADTAEQIFNKRYSGKTRQKELSVGFNLKEKSSASTCGKNPSESKFESPFFGQSQEKTSHFHQPAKSSLN